MALTRYLTVTDPHPLEDGITFTFKLPSFTEVDEAREKRRLVALRSIATTRDTLGSDTWEFLAQARSSTPQDEDSTAVAPVREPGDEFDALALLNLGIVGWNYCEPYTHDDAPMPELVGKPNPQKPIPVNPVNIADLDTPTKQWAFLTLAELCESGFHTRRHVSMRANDDGAIEVEYSRSDDPLPFGARSTAS